MGQVQHSEISLHAASISSGDVVIDNSSLQWSWRLDDGTEVPDDSKYPAAICIFLGHIVPESEGQATGLMLTPVANEIFQRVGMFLMSEPGEHKLHKQVSPARAGGEVHRRIFRLA